MSDFAEVILNLPVDRPFTYLIPEGLRGQIRPGVHVRVPFRDGEAAGYVVRLADRCDFPNVKAILDAGGEVTADEKLLELARWVAARYGCSWGEALGALVPTGVKKDRAGRQIRLVSAGEGAAPTPKQAAVLEFARNLEAPLPVRDFARRAGASAALVRAMLKAGLLKETRVRAEVDSMADVYVEKPREIRLTPEQEEALATVEKGGVILLHGVTGSGKTEVYLRAIERTVAAGKQAIMLVPEISLTPQTVARFKARFPRTAVLHSVLSEGDRAGQWRAVRAGEADVIVGARSAVFAPTRALGLVVIDEEHEGAYKQESVPRYHAREVAIHRARLEGAAVILGSATPSLESWWRAQGGEFRTARLPWRIGRRGMPEIEIVDMAAERADLKRYPVISRRLEQLMRQASERGEQAILFLNRRGFLTHVSCPRCRWVFRCRRCDAAMTYHRQGNHAVCHHCHETKPLPCACPDCGAGKLLQLGLGTERIEEEVRRILPGAVVSRMDGDSMRTKKDYRASLGALWSGETDILVGTQMIAKGLDVPDVTLVGVVNADTAFHLPDFRAAERTFQLITQVAGRTGRGPLGGRVVVQTFNPDHYAIRSAAAYDFEGFARKELEMRRELGFPPFLSLVRVVVQGGREEAVRAAAGRLGEKIRATFDESAVKLLGPAEAPLFHLKGRARVHLLVKTPSLDAVLPTLRRLTGTVSKGRAIQAILDVDPVNMR